MTDAEVAIERLTAWVRDYGDKKPKEFIGDISMLLVLAMGARKANAESVFRANWPEGLEQGRLYQFNCDDDGRDGEAFFRVLVADDGDVHLCASKLIEPGFTDKVTGERLPSLYAPVPSVRCRTGVGGGRHARTRQALLWLALAIKLDNAELGIEE